MMPEKVAAALHRAIRRAGVRIEGVSIGDPADRATWRVSPASAQAEAQAVIDAWVPPTTVEEQDEEATQAYTPALRAVTLALWEAIPTPKMTQAELAARVIALYKSLR